MKFLIAKSKFGYFEVSDYSRWHKLETEFVASKVTQTAIVWLSLYLIILYHYCIFFKLPFFSWLQLHVYASAQKLWLGSRKVVDEAFGDVRSNKLMNLVMSAMKQSQHWHVANSILSVDCWQLHPIAYSCSLSVRLMNGLYCGLLWQPVRVLLLQLWTLETSKLLCSLAQHSAPINALQFHPSDQILASGSSDKCVWLHHWNIDYHWSLFIKLKTNNSFCLY